jgi:hypothetical protein
VTSWLGSSFENSPFYFWERGGREGKGGKEGREGGREMASFIENWLGGGINFHTSHPKPLNKNS